MKDANLEDSVLQNLNRQSKKHMMETTGKETKSTLSFRSGTLWMRAYQRNNKSKGQKNLRCFPSCCAGYGHQEGFCGQCVAVIFRSHDVSIDPKNLYALGEFGVATRKLKENGETLLLSNVDRNQRTCLLDKNISYLEGFKLPTDASTNNTSDRIVLEYEFNKTLKGWHYGFLGSKKTRNYYHVFRAYIVEKQAESPNKFRIIASVSSPPWQMYCRRRKHTTHSLRQGRGENRRNPDNSFPNHTSQKLANSPVESKKSSSQIKTIKNKEVRRTLVDTKPVDTNINKATTQMKRSLASPHDVFSPRKRRQLPPLDVSFQGASLSLGAGNSPNKLSPKFSPLPLLTPILSSSNRFSSSLGAQFTSNYNKGYNLNHEQKKYSSQWSPMLQCENTQPNAFGYSIPKVIDDIDKFLMETYQDTTRVQGASSSTTPSEKGAFYDEAKQLQYKQENHNSYSVRSNPSHQFIFDNLF